MGQQSYQRGLVVTVELRPDHDAFVAGAFLRLLLIGLEAMETPIVLQRRVVKIGLDPANADDVIVAADMKAEAWRANMRRKTAGRAEP